MGNKELTVVVGDGEHLQHAHRAAGNVEVDHVDRPAGGGLAPEVEHHLGQVLHRGNDQFHVGEVVDEGEPAEDVHKGEHHEESADGPGRCLEDLSVDGEPLAAVLNGVRNEARN